MLLQTKFLEMKKIKIGPTRLAHEQEHKLIITTSSEHPELEKLKSV